MHAEPLSVRRTSRGSQAALLGHDAGQIGDPA